MVYKIGERYQIKEIIKLISREGTGIAMAKNNENPQFYTVWFIRS